MTLTNDVGVAELCRAVGRRGRHVTVRRGVLVGLPVGLALLLFDHGARLDQEPLVGVDRRAADAVGDCRCR